MMKSFPTPSSCAVGFLLLQQLQQCIAQAINFTVKVTFASEDEIRYDTGLGLPGALNEVQLRVMDRCIYTGGTSDPVQVGAWYPESIAAPVAGITTNISRINAPTGTGPGNVILWAFDQLIETNTAIYTRIDEFTAQLKFCVQVTLFTDGSASNWDELDVFVPINYAKAMFEDDDNTTGGFALGIRLGPEESFFDSHEFNYTLSPDQLNAYFCDPDTHLSLPQGSTSHQGSIISICFDVVDGQVFEVEDIMELHVVDAGGSLAQVTVFMDRQTAEPIYAEKYCRNNLVNAKVRTCIARFLLKAEFYDYRAVSLHGFGSLLLRLENRRELVSFRGHRQLSDAGLAGYRVQSQYFKIEQNTLVASASTSWLHGMVMAWTVTWVVVCSLA